MHELKGFIEILDLAQREVDEDNALPHKEKVLVLCILAICEGLQEIGRELDAVQSKLSDIFDILPMPE